MQREALEHSAWHPTLVEEVSGRIDDGGWVRKHGAQSSLGVWDLRGGVRGDQSVRVASHEKSGVQVSGAEVTGDAAGGERQSGRW